MDKRFVSGVVVGALALCLCQLFSRWWVAELINGSTGDWRSWRFALAFALSSTASVLPGLCAGVISGRRGFLAGVLAGALGSVLYGVYDELMQVHAGAFKLNSRTWTAVFIFPTIYAAGLMISSAVGGAAGQMLRSNNRWRRP